MKIGVLGAGTWGTALARMLSNTGNNVVIWSAIESEVEEYSRTRKHPNLPGMEIPGQIGFTADIEKACADKDIVLFAVPSVFVRSTAAKAASYIDNNQIIVDVAKGIEPETLLTMTQIIEEELVKEGNWQQNMVSRCRLLKLLMLWSTRVLT